MLDGKPAFKKGHFFPVEDDAVIKLPFGIAFMPLGPAPDLFVKLSPRAPIARVDIEDVLFKGRAALRRKAEGVELFQRARLNADAVYEQRVLLFGEHFAHH